MGIMQLSCIIHNQYWRFASNHPGDIATNRRQQSYFWYRNPLIAEILCSVHATMCLLDGRGTGTCILPDPRNKRKGGGAPSERGWGQA